MNVKKEEMITIGELMEEYIKTNAHEKEAQGALQIRFNSQILYFSQAYHRGPPLYIQRTKILLFIIEAKEIKIGYVDLSGLV